MGQSSTKKLPLRQWRLRKLLSARELARRAGVSRDALARAERGHKVWEVTAHRIAQALDVDLSEVTEFAQGSLSHATSVTLEQDLDLLSRFGADADSTAMEAALLSEPRIAKDWLTPEEDEYWAHLAKAQ